MKKKILILIHSGKYPEHQARLKGLKELLTEEGNETFLVDMSDKESHFEQYRKIKSFGAEIILTMDLAGFELRTETGSITLNQLPCLMFHLLFHPVEDYGKVLQEPFNFSMFFYAAADGDRMRLEQNYPNIENALCMPEKLLQSCNPGVPKQGQRAAWLMFYEAICNEMILQ